MLLVHVNSFHCVNRKFSKLLFFKMASLSWNFYFLPLIQLFLFTYGLILVSLDIIFACSITTLALVATTIFYLSQTRTLPVAHHDGADRFFQIDRNSKVQILNSDIFVIAHRTASLDAPENSLSGIRMAKEVGANAVHFDVRVTSDEIPVLFHDENVDRITTQTGKLHLRALAEVKDLDISSKLIDGCKFADEKIATLDEAVEECLRLQIKMLVQFRIYNWQACSTILRQLLTEHPQLSEGMLMVASDSPLFLYRVHREFDGVLATALVWRPRIFSQSCPTGFLDQSWPLYKDLCRRILAETVDTVYAWALPRIVWKICNVDTVILHMHVLSVEAVKKWAATGVRILACPVNSPTDKMFTERTLKIGYLTDIFSTNVPT